MTFEDALGRPIEDLEDMMRAYVGFDLAKHGLSDHYSDWNEAVTARIDGMSNSEFLAALSAAQEEVKARS